MKNFFLTWFPSYLVAERGFTLIKVGFYAMMPPLCAIVGELLVGHYTDHMVKRGVSVTHARKIPLCIGMLLSSIVVAAVFADGPLMAILFLTISYTALIAASIGIWAMPGDIARNKAEVGTIGGIQNTFSNIAGIIAPIITGWLVGLTGSFMLPLVISGLLAILGAASYWFVVGELRPVEDDLN